MPVDVIGPPVKPAPVATLVTVPVVVEKGFQVVPSEYSIEVPLVLMAPAPAVPAVAVVVPTFTEPVAETLLILAPVADKLVTVGLTKSRA